MTSLIPSLTVVEGIPRASSLDIATHFKKRHVDVMRAINNSVTQVPEYFAQRNFAFSDYQDATGRNLPKCDLSHDGFSFVAMGFTGQRAAQWKVAYIMAFNAMRDELTKRKRLGRPRKALPPAALPEPVAIPDPLSEHYIRLYADNLRGAMANAKNISRRLRDAVSAHAMAVQLERGVYGSPYHALMYALHNTCSMAFEAWEREAEAIEQSVKAMRILAVDMR